MRHIFFECIGGASGDMILASLIDLGASVEKIKREINSLPFEPHEHISIEIEEVLLNGIKGTKAKILTSHQHQESLHHSHRGFYEIKNMIEKSNLSSFVKERSIAIFRRLGEVEAKVHGKTLAEVHFHEIGALDSIVDIVGSCLALEELKAERIAAGTFPCGYGTINCAHGVLPNPAPAMILLAEGHKVEYVDEPYELVTPTAAAFLTTGVSEDFLFRTAQVLKVGYGIGHRELKQRPNILRATLLEESSDNNFTELLYERCILLESNIDDMTPELMGALFEKLLQSGALEVFYTPIQMKKQRPAFLLSVLCKETDKQKLLNIIFRESTTLGVREHNISRYVLPRRIEKVKTEYGEIRIKIAYLNGEVITAAPEYEDCLRIANEQSISLKRVYEAAIVAISNQKLQKG